MCGANETPSAWDIEAFSRLKVLLKRIAVPMIFASGRQFAYVEALIQAVDIISEFPSICENGSGFYYPRTKQIEPHPKIAPDKIAVLENIKKRFSSFVESHGGHIEHGREFCMSLIPAPNSLIDDYFLAVVNHITEFNGLVEITHSYSAVDITLMGINKGSALIHLLGEIPMDPTNVLAIGDSKNDLSMFKEIEHSGCPSNAMQEVKDVVKYVSPHASINGVIDIIETHT